MARALRSFTRRAVKINGKVEYTDRQFARFAGPIWGICVHTTGRGIPKLARKRHEKPMETAIRYYSDTSSPCPHYVIDGLGVVEQITSTTLVAPHIGVSAKEREDMLDGDWIAHPSDHALELWRAKWKGYESPQHLFPTRSPNASYIGIELIPQIEEDANGELFTAPQYSALAIFVARVAEIHKIDTSDQRKLLGHEDLDPYGRWDSRGGWDPGALRDKPYFRWDRVKP
jgi:hypothetical protein